VKAASSGIRYVNIGGGGEKTSLPQLKGNSVVGIIPIAEGCLGACSYCATKKARGALRSYGIRSIALRVERFLAEGAREIWLTAQDTGAYGLDAGTSLPRLLNAVCELDGDFRVRVGMMNPNHAKSMLGPLLESFSHPKMYRFLHLPVQSGDDGVLRDMGRRYTVAEFNAVVEAFRPLDATISTDVILGYPTESEEAFQNTLRLIEEAKPDVLNSTRYWPRPGTAAAALKQLPGSETKRRSRMVSDLFKKVGLERNRRWVGWRGSCLPSERNPDGTATARNDWYKPIIIDGAELGERLDAEIQKATYYDLRGRRP
jgi:threonylcarbamoyladenosine tRNA methylthiotransferase CDKAL1